MGNNSFAPSSINPQTFVVKNTAITPKTIFIFNYPINWQESRDLMRIPGVAESDIRASLLKGTLNYKIRALDIQITASDIDLTQYNLVQGAFLQNAGVVNGLAIGTEEITTALYNLIIDSGGGGGLTPDSHETLRQLIHFIDQGPGDGFASGAFKVIEPTGNPFPSSIIWYVDDTMTKTIVSKSLTYNSSKFPTIIEWNMYDTDGITIVHTVTDTISYSGAFESTRVRAIS